MTDFSYANAMLAHEQQLIANLKLALANYEPGQFSVGLKDKNSMWKVSSAIQKCVRRGWWQLAEKYVTAMINGGQAGYLWYRLPVIALEDIGLGDLEVCGEVLAVSRLAANRKEFDQQKLLKYLIVRLAKARKSRALCDMTCFVNSVSSKSTKLNKFATSSSVDGQLTVIGSPVDSTVGLGERTYLIRRLLGDRAWETAQELEGPPVEPGRASVLGWVVGGHATAVRPADYLFWASTKVKAHGLHEPLPLLVNPIEPQSEKVTVLADPVLVGGVPDISFDWHVSDGKRAISYFGKACAPVKEWFEERADRKINVLSAIGMALFQEESAVLDRLLCSPTLDMILMDNDAVELADVGFVGDEGMQFRSLLQVPEIRETLLKVRRRVVEGTKYD